MEEEALGIKVSLDSQNTEVPIPVDEESTQLEGDSKGVKGKRRRKLTSEVWAHFDILPVGADMKQRAKCKSCGTVYMCDSKYGTGNLRRHMQNCERRDTRDIGQLLISQDKGVAVLSSKRFDPERFRELVTSAIILHDLPFSFVEYEGIRAIFQYVHPDINLVSRNTLKSDVLKMYAKEKARIKSMLDSNPSRICLTSDLWTSIVTDGYLTITAHFIDKDWVLHKRILNFRFMPPPHSGVALSSTIYSLLCEWGIESKVCFLLL